MRAFISVELPDEVKARIGESLAGLKKIDSGIKWVETENLHLTLKFLGWVEEKDLDRLVKGTEEAAKGFPAFRMRIEGAGSFPEVGSPRVFWLGVTEGKAELEKIAAELERRLSGFRSEERGFSAHLTIGRVKDKKGVDKVKEKMGKVRFPDPGAIMVDHIKIMKSTLTPRGPIYEVYKSIELKEEKL